MPSSFDFLEAEFNNNTRNTFFSRKNVFVCSCSFWGKCFFSECAL